MSLRYVAHHFNKSDGFSKKEKKKKKLTSLKHSQDTAFKLHP